MAAWFNYVYFAYGGELTDSSGKLAIDKDACVKGLTIWDTMNKEGLFEPNVTAGDFTAQTKSMVSGDASATITGPWLDPQLRLGRSEHQVRDLPDPDRNHAGDGRRH